MNKKLNELGIKAMQELIFNAFDIFNISEEKSQELFNALPEYIKADFYKWGMGDTPTRDSAYVWLQENEKQLPL